MSNSLKSTLIGAWRLTGYFSEVSATKRIYPLGEDAIGYIMYTTDGIMSATLMRPGRPTFAANDAMGGTADELSAAAAGYLSYAGAYTVDEESAVVTHHLQIALVPNWAGNDFKRKVILNGDDMELRGLAPSLTGGEMGIARVLWRRVR